MAATTVTSQTCYVYILLLKNGKYYCGITADLQGRLRTHCMSGKGYVQRIGMEAIVAIEHFNDRLSAAIVERRIKKFGVRKYYFRYHHKAE